LLNQEATAIEFDDLSRRIHCNSCENDYGVVSEFADAKNGIQFCGVCRCRDLYKQKDFSRKVGCAIVAIGAILAPFTKLISLLVCALIDLVLYLVLPVITICYRCKGIYRDFADNPSQEGFNLGINDRYSQS
jgi:hypothetical protein